MFGVADSDGWRVVAFLLVALLALVAGIRERRQPLGDATWPAFWLLTAGLLTALALGRAGDLGAWLADLTRERAFESGWYDRRRPVQATVVVGLGLAWVVIVGLACWRTPERRRRYLPMSVAAITVAAFAAVRIVSLHQLDAVLQRPGVFGLRIGTAIEYSLLAVAAVLTVWRPGRTKGSDERPSSSLRP